MSENIEAAIVDEAVTDAAEENTEEITEGSEATLVEDSEAEVVAEAVEAEVVAEAIEAEAVEAEVVAEAIEAEAVEAEVVAEAVEAEVVAEAVEAEVVAEAVEAEVVAEAVEAEVVAEAVEAEVVAEAVEAEVVAEAVEAEVVAEAVEAEVVAEAVEAEVVAEAVEAEVVAEAVEAEVVAEAVEAEVVAEAVEAEVVAEAVEAEVVAEAVEAEVVAEAIEAEVVAEAVEAEVVAETAETESAETTDEADTKATDGSDKVVRVLSVGMEVPGVVKRTTDFGAFVDIGVGRDGLVHISELSVRRVAKVSDVVKQGQEITAWIKELDRSRNRISLTLIAPGTKTIRDLEKDEIVNGTVSRIVPYGAFIDIGVGRDALLHIREMAVGYVNKPEDVVQVGEEVEARIIEVSRRRGRIDLSLKGLRPEPETEQAAGGEAQVVEEEEEIEDPFANMEVLSPMELAFQKAMSGETEEIEGMTKKRSKRARRDQMRAIQDEIVSRTLDGSDRNK